MRKRDWKRRHYQYDGSIPKIQRFAAEKQPCGKVKETCRQCKGVGKHAFLLNKRGTPLSCPACQGMGYLMIACACRGCKAIGKALKQLLYMPASDGTLAPALPWITANKTPEPQAFMRPKGIPEHVMIRRRLAMSHGKFK